jgi:hypothetical protein
LPRGLDTYTGARATVDLPAGLAPLPALMGLMGVLNLWLRDPAGWMML